MSFEPTGKTEQKIKLVIAINDFRIGGAQKLVADIVRRIDTHKFELCLITLSQKEAEKSFYEELDGSVRVEKINFKGFTDISAWRVLYKTLKDLRPDVVCSNLFFSNTVLRVLKPLFSYKVIIVEHNVYLHKPFSQRTIDWLLSHLSYQIVGVSKQVRDYTSKSEHISEEKFTVIQNGVDRELYAQSAKETNLNEFKRSLGLEIADKVVLSVGQLINQKNHSLLIQAFSEFQKDHPHHKLVIIGEGSLRNKLETKITERGLTGKVLLMGIRKDVASFYAIADFFVLPSLFEGFALVCIEAMATGLPVIATKVAGPNEYVKPGMNGLFTEFDPFDLQKQMSHLADLPAPLRETLAAGARITAAQYDISHTVNAYENLFSAAVK